MSYAAAPLLMPAWMLGATCTTVAVWWMYQRSAWAVNERKRAALERLVRGE